jgi:RNA polymerase sigma-70 factor (ECF subfamily)
VGETKRLDESQAERESWSEAADLVRRIELGDPNGEAEFVRRYRRGVAVIVSRAGGAHAPIEDLCQDVLTTALQRIRAGAVRDPERLSGFVAGLARVTVIGYFRKEASRRAIESRMPSRPGAVGPAVVDQLLQQECATIVRAVLAELESDRDRQILFRFYIVEDDKERICADLELTPIHFNRVLFRARERYRELYRQWIAAHGLGDVAG